jgi:hypothetical protein
VRDFYENEEEPEISSNSPPSAPEPQPEVNKPMSMYSMEELHRINKFKERQAKVSNAQAQKETQPLAQSPENAPKEETKENASNSTNLNESR